MGIVKKKHKYDLCDNMVCIHDYDMRKYAYKLQQDYDDCNLFHHKNQANADTMSTK